MRRTDGTLRLMRRSPSLNLKQPRKALREQRLGPASPARIMCSGNVIFPLSSPVLHTSNPPKSPTLACSPKRSHRWSTGRIADRRHTVGRNDLANVGRLWLAQRRSAHWQQQIPGRSADLRLPKSQAKMSAIQTDSFVRDFLLSAVTTPGQLASAMTATSRSSLALAPAAA